MVRASIENVNVSGSPGTIRFHFSEGGLLMAAESSAAAHEEIELENENKRQLASAVQEALSRLKKGREGKAGAVQLDSVGGCERIEVSASNSEISLDFCWPQGATGSPRKIKGEKGINQKAWQYFWKFDADAARVFLALLAC